MCALTVKEVRCAFGRCSLCQENLVLFVNGNYKWTFK